MIVYRVVQARWKDDIWSGTGSWKHDGRWHTKGHRVVYAAQSLSLATLETLVHLRKTKRLTRYFYSWAEVPDALIETFPRHNLPRDWLEPKYPASTKQIGDAWLEGEKFLALLVPRAATPSELDVLINPEHSAFSQVRVLGTMILVLDPRLRK